MSTFSKKVTSAVAGLAIVFSMVSPIAGVSAAMSSLDAANELATLGVIVDQSANPAAYRLGDNLPRKEAVKVMMNLSSVAVVNNCAGKFSDLPSSDWACKYAETALANGMVAGNATFRPNDLVSKIEALKMVFQGRGLEKGSNSDWRVAYVEAAVEMGILDAAFTDYNTPATRGEMFIWAAEAADSEEVAECDILTEILGGCETEEETDTGSGDTTEEEVTGGEVEVSLSPLSPKATSVAAGKDRTPILAFDVTAGDTDITLSDVTLGYVGLSDADDFNEIAMYIGNNKITKQDGKQFDSDKEAELTFENDTVIQAGKTVTVMVTANVALNGNVAHQVKLLALDTSADDVTMGDIKSVVFTTVSATNTATLDINVDGVSSTPTLGETETLAEFTLEEQLDNEDVVVKSLTLEIGGGLDAEDDLADLVLLADGEEVASDLTVNSDDEVVIDLDLVIPADEAVDFELQGVVTGSIGETLTVSLTEVYAVGADTGIIAGLTGDSLPALSGNFSAIDGSEINVSFDKSDIDEARPAAEDVLVGTLSMMAASEYTVNELEVTVDSDGGADIADILANLELDGRSYDSVVGDTSSTAVFTFEDIDLDAGVESTLDLVTEIEDNVALNGETLEFSVEIIEVEDQDNNETFNASSTPDLDSVLSSNSFDSKNIDIESASYDIVQTNISDRELVLGNGIEVVLYQGKLSVGDADSVLFKDFLFDGNFNQPTLYDFEDILDSVTLNIGGETVDGDVNAGDIEFNSANIEVEAGSDNVEFVVTAVLTDNDSVNNGDDFWFTLSSGDITAEDSDNEDVTNTNVTAASSTTLITMNDAGTFRFNVVNDGENEDMIDDVVLAGTDGVALAELELESTDEDMKVKELSLMVPNVDMSTTLDNVRIMNGSTVVADGATVTYDGSDTYITFKDDFVVEDTGDQIDAVLVADLEIFTTEGGSVSAVADDITVEFDYAEVTGVSSNDDIVTNTAGTVTSNAVAVVPVLMTVTVVDALGTDDDDAIIEFNLDFGNNDLDSNDVVVNSIALEAAVASGNVTIRNDDNSLVTITDDSVTPLVLTALNEINDGDQYTFEVGAEGDEVVIDINGITYTVDGNTYTSLNDKVIDLDKFTDSTN